MPYIDENGGKRDGTPAPLADRPTPILTDDDLETILAIARNRQSGRITEYEIKALVAAYRRLHFPRPLGWASESPMLDGM